MKKLCLAVLATMAPAAALANSSVTLYGLVDAGYAYKNQKTTFSGDTGATTGSIKQRTMGVRNGLRNGNRWGMKGKEDLGNGTSAIFTLESGFNLGDGFSAQGGRLFGRQAFVGLTGESWGTFTIGRQYNATDVFIQSIDPFGHNGWQNSSVSGFNSSHSYRYDNLVKYSSPNFSGFRFVVGGFYEHKKEDWEDNTGVSTTAKDRFSGLTAGLGYRTGALAIGATFDYVDQKNENNLTSRQTKTKQWNLGMTYDFDVAKLHLLYGQQRDGTFFGIGLANDILNPQGNRTLAAQMNSSGFRQQSWLAGVTVPVSDAGQVLFSYQGNAIKNDEVAALNGARIKTHIFSLGYVHNLSKRTNMNIIASHGTSKLKFNDALSQQRKLKSTDIQLGLQHRF